MRTLYLGYISPYSRRIRVVLREKGLDYEEEVLQFAQAPESYDALNPCRRVPVLRDDEQTLFESNTIIRYLLHTYPGRVAATETPALAEVMARPDHRWDDLQLLDAIETLQDSGLVLLQMRNNGIGPDQSEYLGREQNRIRVLLDWLEPRASPQGFIPGSFSIQDLNLLIALQWADFRKLFEWRGRPNIEGLVERFSGRESLRTTGPEITPA